MVVAPGATDVPLPRRRLARAVLVRSLAVLSLQLGIQGVVYSAQADESVASPIHYSGDRQVWDRKNNKVELFGHAVVNQPGETLTADYIRFDLKTRIMDAKGNCIYIANDTLINADEMHFNLETRTGTIISGRVSNEKFTLAGERINKLGDTHFQTHEGQYSTCRDCPEAWSVLGEDVDMEFGGYAYMSNVTVRVKDAPAFWLPYLILPVKTSRQTGFLFPKFGSGSNDGFRYIQPFFWAINKSSDATIGVGEYTARGFRTEAEGRYALSPRSHGIIDYDFVHDKSYTGTAERYGLGITQTQELPFGFEEKIHYFDVSDNQYPIDFQSDVPGYQEPVLASNIIFSKTTPEVSAYIAMERFRNLIGTNPDPTAFDPGTVQAYPNAAITTNDQFLFGGPVATGLTVGMSNFTRTGGPFDYDPSSTPGAPFRPGIDPVREATRIAVTPSVYTTFRPFDIFSLVPSLKYEAYFYNFHNAYLNQNQNNLSRGYLLFQTDLSTQLERIWDTDDPKAPKKKHLIRPILTYSNIPFRSEPNNSPFLTQINNNPGYEFDNNDVVPLDASQSSTNYFDPLGNSLAYGFSTQLITRREDINPLLPPSYERTIEFDAGQSIDLREFQFTPSQPMSRFFGEFTVNTKMYQSDTSYYYYPYAPGIRSQFSTQQTYYLEKGYHQRILTFDRSLTMGYTWNQVGCPGTGGTNSVYCQAPANGVTEEFHWSLNDYLLPIQAVSYDFVAHTITHAHLEMQFQSPSQCWAFNLGADYQLGGQTSIITNLSLNLAGSGFGGTSSTFGQVPTPTNQGPNGTDTPNQPPYSRSIYDE